MQYIKPFFFFIYSELAIILRKVSKKHGVTLSHRDSYIDSFLAHKRYVEKLNESKRQISNNFHDHTTDCNSSINNAKIVLTMIPPLFALLPVIITDSVISLLDKLDSDNSSKND